MIWSPRSTSPPPKISPCSLERERSLFAVEGNVDVGCGSPHAQLDRHPPYGFNRVRTLVARTVSPQLSWLWLLLQHPPILAYIYTQSSSIPRIVETRLELMVEISGCSRKCVTDSIRHTRDPNSTRVLDRKIRRSSSFERNFLLDQAFSLARCRNFTTS